MKIGGLQKLTLIDYPDKVAATVFLIGCNFKCPFCQNPELVDLEEIKKQSRIEERDFFNFLDQRKKFLEGVCITGGEPTIQPDLIDFIKKIKAKGFLIKLDTNGSNPEVLSKLVSASRRRNLLDFVAMDIKTSLDKYEKAIGIKFDLEKIKQSVELIKNSGIDYEFRTTVVPGIIDEKDIEEIGKWLKGGKKFALQQFQNKKVLDKEFTKIEPYSEEILKSFKKILEKYISEVELRL